MHEDGQERLIYDGRLFMFQQEQIKGIIIIIKAVMMPW
jgi:hypothetical protein